jgi:hypothetical protein
MDKYTAYVLKQSGDLWVRLEHTDYAALTRLCDDWLNQPGTGQVLVLNEGGAVVRNEWRYRS